jgi:hypothetical protein
MEWIIPARDDLGRPQDLHHRASTSCTARNSGSGVVRPRCRDPPLA